MHRVLGCLPKRPELSRFGNLNLDTFCLTSVDSVHIAQPQFFSSAASHFDFQESYKQNEKKLSKGLG